MAIVALFLTARQTMTIGHALAISVLVSVASAGAVFSAALPRDKNWRIAKRRERNLPAWGYYIASGAIALVLQSPFTFVYRLARDERHAVAEAWEMFLTRDLIGWLWLSFVMAAGLAALIDRERPLGCERFGRRTWVLEGALLGAVSGFTGLLIALTLGAASAPLGPVITLLALLGFVLGAIVPTVYRDAPRARREELVRGEPAMRMAQVATGGGEDW
jgi:hypothetical protein